MSIDTECRATRMTIRAHMGSALATAAVFSAIASTGIQILKLEPKVESERPVYYLAPPKEFMEARSVAPEVAQTIDTSSMELSIAPSEPELTLTPIKVGFRPGISSQLEIELEMSRDFKARAPTLGELDAFTIYDQIEVDERPRIRYSPPPEVGFELRGEEVEVMMFYYVTAKGRPESISVLYSSSENAAYGEAAKEAISTWRFRPARKNGNDVPCWIQQSIKFNRKHVSPFSI